MTSKAAQEIRGCAYFENDHLEMSKTAGVTRVSGVKGSFWLYLGQGFILLSHPTILVHKPSEPISLSL